MGMSTGGSKKGGISEINITPLVDVVLVLLIIFIVIAPLLTSEIPIRIPEQVQDDVPIEVQPDNKQIVLQLRSGGPGNTTITINNSPVAKSELAGQLQKFYAGRSDKLIFFDAADDVLYGETVQVLEIVHKQGLTIGVTPDKINAN